MAVHPLLSFAYHGDVFGAEEAATTIGVNFRGTGAPRAGSGTCIAASSHSQQPHSSAPFPAAVCRKLTGSMTSPGGRIINVCSGAGKLRIIPNAALRAKFEQARTCTSESDPLSCQACCRCHCCPLTRRLTSAPVHRVCSIRPRRMRRWMPWQVHSSTPSAGARTRPRAGPTACKRNWRRSGPLSKRVHAPATAHHVCCTHRPALACPARSCRYGVSKLCESMQVLALERGTGGICSHDCADGQQGGPELRPHTRTNAQVYAGAG